MRAFIPLFFLVALASCDAASQSRASALSVEQAWAAPTPAGIDVSAGYLTITNGSGAEDRLLSATSPRAARVEIHEMSMDGSVMRMRAVENLAVPAGQAVEFAPGGMHLMFFGVNEPFTQGQNVPVRLTFETAGQIDVTLPVRRTAPRSHSGH